MNGLKIMVVHNRYLQPGGEDAVYEAEATLLEQRGCEVIRFEETNQPAGGLISKIETAASCTWSLSSHRRIAALLKQHKPDVVHFHNFFQQVSPSAYYACQDAGVPVVQTLHNFRLICAAATLSRDGKVCEECLEQGIWHGLKYNCYRGNKMATAALALMVDFHRRRQTWATKVDRYIALTEFARRKLVEGGLPPERFSVKPNFVLPDPGPRSFESPGDYALFVGRIDETKGLPVLVEAWRRLTVNVPLVILGDGNYRPQLEASLRESGLGNIEYRGRATREQMFAAMKQARFLVFPSIWYEGFPVTIAEAYACGVPVLASRLGSMEELILDGITGLHFEAGNPDDLAATVARAWRDPEEMLAMGRAARVEFDSKYTADRNYDMLVEIYREVQRGIPLNMTPIRATALAGSTS